MQKALMVSLWMIAALLCLANVYAFCWQPKAPTPSAKVQKQIALVAAHQAGVAEARRDISKGILALKSAGLPAGWSKQYRQILRTRYSIARGAGLGCTGSEEQFTEIDGYNRVMRAEIERRYGKGILGQVAQEAKVAYDKERQNAPQKR